MGRRIPQPRQCIELKPFQQLRLYVLSLCLLPIPLPRALHPYSLRAPIEAILLHTCTPKHSYKNRVTLLDRSAHIKCPVDVDEISALKPHPQSASSNL